MTITRVAFDPQRVRDETANSSAPDGGQSRWAIPGPRPQPAAGLIPPRPDWNVDAACRGIDPDLFFPPRGVSTQPAKAICATCPVRAECLEYALDTNELFGVWGGKSGRERKALRRLRNGDSPMARVNRRKLSDDQIRAIRRRRADGERLTVLAVEYGVTVSAIDDCVTRRTWNHVA